MPRRKQPLRTVVRAVLIAAGCVASVASFESSGSSSTFSYRIDLATREDALYSIEALEAPDDRSIDVQLDLSFAPMDAGERFVFGGPLPDAGPTVIRVARMDSRPTALARGDFRDGGVPADARVLGTGSTLPLGMGTRVTLSDQPMFLLLTRSGGAAVGELRLSVQCNEAHCGYLFLDDLTAVGGAP